MAKRKGIPVCVFLCLIIIVSALPLSGISCSAIDTSSKDSSTVKDASSSSNTSDIIIPNDIDFSGDTKNTSDKKMYSPNPFQVATPTFSPSPGQYWSTQQVSISCSTPGASIRYTVNGNDPGNTSTAYSGPITINQTTRIKAKGFKSGMMESYVAEAPFLFRVATPTFSTPEGQITYPKQVSITCSTPGATIRYTTGGSEPTSSSTAYSNPITINQTTTIKAKAFKTGIETSLLATMLPNQVAAPIFTWTRTSNYWTQAYPGSSLGYNVTISCNTSGASIYYTVDGSEPTSSFTNSCKQYFHPIYVDDWFSAISNPIKAKAFKSGMTESLLVRSPNIPDTPTFSLPSGTYTSTQTVQISCNTPDTRIFFTVNGGEPTQHAESYTRPLIFAVGGTYTIKARAHFTSGTQDGSYIRQRTYFITSKVATPIFSPPGGKFIGSQQVSISCSTNGAIIRCTTDGSEPTSSSGAYSNPITINHTTTIKAKAFKSELVESDVASATYTIPLPRVATPIFSPSVRQFVGNVDINISCSTNGAIIRYTTDGSEPTSSSAAYSGPIHVNHTTTIKAKAFKSGMAESDVASVTYQKLSYQRPTPDSFTASSKGMPLELCPAGY